MLGDLVFALAGWLALVIITCLLIVPVLAFVLTLGATLLMKTLHLVVVLVRLSSLRLRRLLRREEGSGAV